MRFAELSSEQSVAADALVNEVRRAYASGAVKVGLNPDAVLSFLISPVGSLFIDSSATETAVKADYATLGSQIKKWSSTYRTWAERGTRDDGTAYDMERWVDFSKDLLGAVKYQADVAWDSSVVVNAYKAIGATYKQYTNPELWPWWMYAAAASVGVVAVAYLVNTVRPFIPSRRLAGYSRRRHARN